MIRSAIAVIAYAVAMAFLESAVVVYLQRALGIETGAIFPLRDPAGVGDLAAIEVGRDEVARDQAHRGGRHAVGKVAAKRQAQRLADQHVLRVARDGGDAADVRGGREREQDTRGRGERERRRGERGHGAPAEIRDECAERQRPDRELRDRHDARAQRRQT